MAEDQQQPAGGTPPTPPAPEAPSTSPAVRLGVFFQRVFAEFSIDNGGQAAAMLTYTSLLSMVPLMAVGFGSLAAFPVFESLSADLQDFVFQNFVPAAGEVVQSHLSAFAEKASRMTAVGIAFLVLTALMLMSTIDKTLNRIWKVHKPRSLLKAFLVYWAVLTLGPLLIGASLALTSYVVSLPLMVDAETELGLRSKLLTLLPVMSAALAFSLLYLVVPNRPVRVLDALAGGFFAATLFEIAKRLFAWYVTAFPTYEAIYGALAAAPIFLIWVYLSWLVILLGAELAYVLSLRGTLHGAGLEAGQRGFVGVYRMLRVLADAQRAGDEVSVDQDDAAGLDHVTRRESLRRLEQAGLAGRLEAGTWVLLKSASELSLRDVYTASGEVVPEAGFLVGRHPWDDQLRRHLEAASERLADVLERPLVP